MNNPEATMIEIIKASLEALHAMKCYPEVLILASGLYYICRWHLDWGPKRSQYVPLASAFVGIFGYLWPKNAQDVIAILVIGGMHAFIAIGAYSYAEKRGWVDRIGEWIEDKLGWKHPGQQGSGSGVQGSGNKTPETTAGTTPEIQP
jgi:hypothetical protein